MRRAIALGLALVVSPSVVLAAAPGANAIVHKQVTVSGKNDEWTSVDLKVAKGDILLIKAEGQVVVGSWTGAVDADGAPGDNYGRLVMKVGSESGNIGVGKKAYYVADESTGSVKVKVYDTKYGDNSGSFTVTVIKIPAGAVPPAEAVKIDE